MKVSDLTPPISTGTIAGSKVTTETPMPTPLESLVASGTYLWLDSIDPELIEESRGCGASGATSNPIIIANLIRTGRFDAELAELLDRDLDDHQVAWQLADGIVTRAEAAFLDVFERTAGDDGYVSFELDPLLEESDAGISKDEVTTRYVELARHWSHSHPNRMIKIPATPAGLMALEDIVAAGVPVNVTLVFTNRQHRLACEAAWRGAQRLDDLRCFKSVYSVFVSRLDVYTTNAHPDLSTAARRLVGIVNAKRIYRANCEFWQDKPTPLRQQIVFASTGTKDPEEPVDKYVAALAGADIQTNPPGTNAAIQDLADRSYTRTIDESTESAVLEEIDRELDFEQLETVLMEEGIVKFAAPQRELLELVAEHRTDHVA